VDLRPASSVPRVRCRPPPRPIFTLAAMTGMRRGELLGLDWTTSTRGSTVIVRRARVAVGYIVSTGTPKSGEGRLIDLDEHTVTVLRAWRKRQRRSASPPGPDGSAHLCIHGRVRSPANPHAVFGYFERAVRDTGLPVLTSRPSAQPRHRSLQAGVPVRVVAERLGHADQLCPAGLPARRARHAAPSSSRAADIIFGS